MTHFSSYISTLFVPPLPFLLNYSEEIPMCGGPVSLCCYVIPHFYLVCASSLLFLFPSCIYSYSTTNIALRAIHEIGLVPRHVIWRPAAAKVLVSCPARARLPAVEYESGIAHVHEALQV